MIEIKKQKMHGSVQSLKKNHVCVSSKVKNYTRSFSAEMLGTGVQKRPVPAKKLSSTQNYSLSQSKTTKMLKKKSRKNIQTSQTIKTIKKKQRESHDKQNIHTGKKFNKKSKKKHKINKEQILEKEQELTERKKIHLEYFLFKNVYVPIENTEQRKLAYKLELIQKDAVEQNPPSLRERGVTTECPSLREVSTEMEIIPKSEAQMQTDNQNRPSLESENEKCLVEALSDLQFLYLPDDRNFEGFSKSEKQHYKELLLFIAKKFQGQQSQQIIDEDKIRMILCHRQCTQRGLIEWFPQEGFPTHVPSILSYLSNFFCFISLRQKTTIVERLNSIYGYECMEKLKRIREGKSTKRASIIIPESIFTKVEEELFQCHDFKTPLMEKMVHYHNRAVFDAINQCLSEFQPYYYTNGQVFGWNKSLNVTFYSIDEESFSLIQNQILEKIQAIAWTLAGLHLQSINSTQRYRVHFLKILEHERLMIEKEIKAINEQTQIEELTTQVLLELSSIIENQILLDCLSPFA